MTVHSKKIKLTNASGNVFADLGLLDADQYIVKADLAHQINRVIKNNRLKKIDVAKLFGIEESEILALSSGRLDNFSVERLSDCLDRLAHAVAIRGRKKPIRRKSHKQSKVVFG